MRDAPRELHHLPPVSGVCLRIVQSPPPLALPAGSRSGHYVISSDFFQTHLIYLNLLFSSMQQSCVLQQERVHYHFLKTRLQLPALESNTGRELKVTFSKGQIQDVNPVLSDAKAPFPFPTARALNVGITRLNKWCEPRRLKYFLKLPLVTIQSSSLPTLSPVSGSLKVRTSNTLF